jgi:zinc D-Ala-D-Ala carboxypeptidase
MKLTEHFTLEEMTKSQTGARKGIINNPGQAEIGNLKALCENVLEKVRAHFGKPITVNSGYRCPKLNRAIGGAKNSQHITGQAADIEIAGVDNQVLFQWIRDNLEFDQLISEYIKPDIANSGWVHVSWNPAGNRKNVLIIK